MAAAEFRPTLAQRYAKMRETSRYAFVCEQCGVNGYRRIGGKQWEQQKRGLHPNRFCSNQCRYAAAEAQRQAPFCKITIANCKRCGGQFAGRVTRKFCSDVCRVEWARAHAVKPPRRIICIDCKSELLVSGSGGKKLCDKCAAIRKCTQRNESRRKRRQKHGHMDRWRKRCRALGVPYEPISYIKVFQRDGWKCQICGKRTPRERKGTRYANAPELDHRQPITRGGAHTYDNVQCACKVCNGEKSNKRSTGQLPLWGVYP